MSSEHVIYLSIKKKLDRNSSEFSFILMVIYAKSIAVSGTGITRCTDLQKLRMDFNTKTYYPQATRRQPAILPLDPPISPIGALEFRGAIPKTQSPTMRPTQALSVGRYRHLKLTVKDVNKGFYKGNRTGSMGRHTKYGGYVIEWNKVRTYAVPPNLKDFKVGSRAEVAAWD